MENDPETQSAELRVNFFPELFLQRRIWILNILRREGVCEVCHVFIASVSECLFIHARSWKPAVERDSC